MRRRVQIGLAVCTVLLLAGCDPEPANTAKAVDDNATVMSGQSVTIDVLENDTDTSGIRNPTKWIRGVTQPAHGTVVVDENTTIVYTPASGFVGIDRFEYTLGIESMTDEANVTVTVTPAPIPQPSAPRADAGKDREIVVGESTELNGTCFATTGEIESCIWYEGSGRLENQEALRGTVATPNKRSIKATYTSTVVGTHTLRLVAVDANAQTAFDEINVTVSAIPSANKPPVADAGEDRNAFVGETITIAGSCTDSEDNIVSCVWSENGTRIANGAAIDYRPTELGVHTLILTAIDDHNLSATDEVNVTVSDAVGTVTIDSLMWEDTDHARNVALKWDDAYAYCDSLTLGGYDNWRLPGTDENNASNLEPFLIRKLPLKNGTNEEWDPETDDAADINGSSRTIIEPFALVTQNDYNATWTDQSIKDGEGSVWGYVVAFFAYQKENADGMDKDENVTVRCVRTVE